jgi:hypothetical protein
VGKYARSVEREILDRMKAEGKGTVFTASDFHDLASPSAVYQVLSRCARGGTIRKVARGVYGLPHRDRQLRDVPPSVDAVARAMQVRGALRLQPAGAHAANLLGLSTQVPVRTVFLTDGLSRTVKLGRRQILLKRTTPRQMATAGRISGTVIQALRWIGRPNVDEKTIASLRRRLTKREKAQLLADRRHAPEWIARVLEQIAGEGR